MEMVSDKAVVKNRINPATQLSVLSALMPVRECAFEAVLHKIVGPILVAARKSTCEAAQPGNVRFEKRRRIWDGVLARPIEPFHATSRAHRTLPVRMGELLGRVNRRRCGPK